MQHKQINNQCQKPRKVFSLPWDLEDTKEKFYHDLSKQNYNQRKTKQLPIAIRFNQDGKIAQTCLTQSQYLTKNT